MNVFYDVFLLFHFGTLATPYQLRVIAPGS